MFRSWSTLSAYSDKDRRTPQPTLWSGHARRGIVLRPIDGVLAVIGLLLLVWSGAWVTEAPHIGDHLLAVAVPIVGLWLVAGRLLFDARRRSRTSYIIRSDSILIYVAGVVEARASVPFSDIEELELRGRPRGRGTTIVLHAKSRRALRFMTPSWPLHSLFGPLFIEPEEPAALHAILLHAMGAMGAASERSAGA